LQRTSVRIGPAAGGQGMFRVNCSKSGCRNAVVRGLER
jgi:hypothetical protein